MSKGVDRSVSVVWAESSTAGIFTVSDEVIDSSVFLSEVGGCCVVTIVAMVLGSG